MVEKTYQINLTALLIFLQLCMLVHPFVASAPIASLFLCPLLLSIVVSVTHPPFPTSVSTTTLILFFYGFMLPVHLLQLLLLYPHLLIFFFSLPVHLYDGLYVCQSLGERVQQQQIQRQVLLNKSL